MDRHILPVAAAVLFFHQSVAAYGEKVDSLLLWQERAVLTLTNACRMDPIAFRDRYIGNNTIMLPEKYPAVAPLYWNRELNAAARFHCVEMALTCGMSHDCNGISFAERVKNFYTKSATVGENIAMGYQTPQQVVNAWLIDGQSAAEAAPDGNGDGHRANIMSPRYRELGCGYFLAGSGKSAKAYWCQDFGGGKSSFVHHPVCAASHLFFNKGEITFLVNLYDTTGSVAGLTLLLDGTRHTLKLDMGGDRAGTYTATLPSASACRYYAVEVAFSDGRTLQYPESGTLPTVGEGACIDGGAGTLAALPDAGMRSVRDAGVQMVRRGGACALAVSPAASMHPATTTVIDCKGSRVGRLRWNGDAALLPREVTASNGLLILIHTYPDNSSVATRHMLHR